MSDWNEQGAPNNNLSASTIRSSKLVGKEGLKAESAAQDVAMSEGKQDRDALTHRLMSRQPGM